MPVTEFVPNRTTKLLRFYVARHARMLPHVPPTACAPSWYTRATHSTVPLQQSMSKCPLVCRISAHFVRFASIFFRTCPKRYFSSYLDRSISRFEESVSFDSQSRRFFFIDERQVWEIRSFFLIWESIFNWIHQWINIDHLSMHEWKLSSKVLFSNAFVERCSTSSGSLLKISFRIFSHSIRNKRC